MKLENSASFMWLTQATKELFFTKKCKLEIDLKHATSILYLKNVFLSISYLFD